MVHKCRVYKAAWMRHPWIVECEVRDCFMHRGFKACDKWEYAILSALYHRMFY